MKVLEGHLTATEKKHIGAILGAGLMEGKVGRKEYRMSTTDEKEYSVSITENITRWCETVPKRTTAKHKFKI